MSDSTAITANANGTTPAKAIDVDAATGTEVTGEKRKAPAPDSGSKSEETEEEGGGKDRVEKKQTTLDSVVQHEKAEDKVTHHTDKEKKEEGEEEKDGDGDEERPAKKTKTVVADVVDQEGEEDKATPPAQLSQPSAAASTPHKTVKKVDDIEEKTVEATPTKSTRAADSKAVNGDGNGNTSNPGTEGEGDTVPGDEAHLDHPENWTTGGDPATDKQKGFLKVLEKQKGVPVGDVSGIGKSEASEKIDELKNM